MQAEAQAKYVSVRTTHKHLDFVHLQRYYVIIIRSDIL